MDIFGAFTDLQAIKQDMWWEFLFVDYSHFISMCEKVYENPDVKKLFAKKYDLIFSNIMFAQCFFGIFHLNGSPVILINSFPISNHFMHGFGHYNLPSTVPNPLSSYTDNMDFYQRLVNFASDWALAFLNQYSYIPSFEKVYRKYLGEDLPSVHEIGKNVSLVMQNTHFTSTFHRYSTPDFVEIGGIHCRKAKPLPKELETFASSNAKEGFIFFSLGSVVKSSTLSNSTVEKIIRVFSKLNQNVFWKWETEPLKNLPPNILQQKWFPQQDILGHKNIRFFISHAGLLSTQQTIYHGIPAIFFPVFFDQFSNAQQAVNKGFALQLNLWDFSEKDFENSINQILTHKNFSENAKRVSEIYQDNLNTPLERAIFWTNYVLKYKGAPQLRSSARSLSLIQFHSLDVLAVLILSFIFISSLGYFILKQIFKCLFFSTNKLSTKSNKIKRN